MTKQKGNDLGFAVPNQSSGSENFKHQETVSQNAAEGKRLTLFWLLQHYSKENAAAYKAQKERDKSLKKSPKRDQTEIEVRYTTESDKDMRNPYSTQEVFQNPNSDFGATVFLGEDSRQSFQPSKRAAIECLGFMRTIPVDHLPFRIGKNPEAVDLCIADNEAVSRVHAEISFQNGMYYITDMKSLNHVYLDGSLIPPAQEFPLKNNMKITLGNEDFIFHVDENGAN